MAVARPVLTVDLQPLADSAARALLAGRTAPATGPAWHPEFPLAETLDALALLTATYQALGQPRQGTRWWLHLVLHAGQVVGHAGFHGPPPADCPAEVEIGYAVVPALRGRGLGTAACAALLQRAWHDGAELVLARCDPTNLASRRVLERNGFRRSGDLYRRAAG